jgi:hypothetical protein
MVRGFSCYVPKGSLGTREGAKISALPPRGIENCCVLRPAWSRYLVPM